MVADALQDGKSVRLGDLGSFHVTALSKKSATQAEVDTTKVEKLNVRFRKSAMLRDALRLQGNPKLKFQLRQDGSGK